MVLLGTEIWSKSLKYLVVLHQSLFSTSDSFHEFHHHLWNCVRKINEEFYFTDIKRNSFSISNMILFVITTYLKFSLGLMRKIPPIHTSTSYFLYQTSLYSSMRRLNYRVNNKCLFYYYLSFFSSSLKYFLIYIPQNIFFSFTFWTFIDFLESIFDQKIILEYVCLIKKQ